jgi:hypothetical protein
MSKTRRTSSDNLYKRIKILNLIGIARSMSINPRHTLALRGTEDTKLSLVDIVVKTVHQTHNDASGDALQDGLDIVDFVDGAGAELVVVEGAHGPTDRTAFLTEVGVVLVAGFLEHTSVGQSGVFVGDAVSALGHDFGRGSGAAVTFVGDVDGSATKFASGDFGVTALTGHLDRGRSRGLGLDVAVVIVVNDGVVGDLSKLGIGGSLAGEEKRSEEDVVPLQGVVLADDALVDIGNEEESGQKSKSQARADRDTGDPVSRLLAETELGGTLVNDRECADSTSDQEEEGRGVDSPRDRVNSHVNSRLDEHEDGGTEDGRDEGSHDETSEDGTKTRALCKAVSAQVPTSKTSYSLTVPSPLNTLDTNSGNTDTSNRGNERVGGRNVSIVSCAPHDPNGCTCCGTSEGKKLHRSVTLECSERDDAVLDGRCSSSTDSKRTGQFEYQTQDLIVMD